MKTSLITILSQVKDYRQKGGQRHDLALIMAITIMAVISGVESVRGVAAFIKLHFEEIIKAFNVPKDRLPSYSTLDRVYNHLNIEEIAELIKKWIIENNLIHKGDWISLDGKSIKSTVSDYKSANQNFVSLVSAFAHKSGLVLMSKSFENKKESEISVVEELVRFLGFEGLTFTLDALHAKKNFEHYR